VGHSIAASRRAAWCQSFRCSCLRRAVCPTAHPQGDAAEPHPRHRGHFATDHVGASNTTVRTPISIGQRRVVFGLSPRATSQCRRTFDPHLTTVTEHGVKEQSGTVAVRRHAAGVAPRAGYRDRFRGRESGPETCVRSNSSHLVSKSSTFGARRPRRAGDTNAVLSLANRSCGSPFSHDHYWDPRLTIPPPFDAAYYRDSPYDETFTRLVDVRHPWYHPI
jgi:hypothetical protein